MLKHSLIMLKNMMNITRVMKYKKNSLDLKTLVISAIVFFL